ncbi:MAG: tripartite tricarboxylate transporter substrate-binding protein [Burkholderiales bacterium]
MNRSTNTDSSEGNRSPFDTSGRTVWDLIRGSLTKPTPPAIVKQLRDEFALALQAPDVKENLAALGAEPVGSSTAEFTALILRDIARWAKVVKASGVRLD